MDENNNNLADQMLRYGGGATSTTMTVASLVVLLIAVLLFFVLRRKYLATIFLFVSTFIPFGQVIVIGTLHFMSSRILLPFAWLGMRPFTYLKNHRFKWNGVDKAIVFYGLAATVTGIALWGEWAVLVNRLGFLYSMFGSYFFFRVVLNDRVDVDRIIQTLAILCAIIAIPMLWEQYTGHNLFSVFGGVSDITLAREGRVRSQAGFAHAIVAGTLGATLIPIFLGLWWQGKQWKRIAAVGMVSGMIMTVTSASATPLFALVAGIGALCLWPLRQQMRLIRWGVLLTLVGLHLVMKAPVWALIQRIDIVGGSSGWHRYELIDQCIKHFSDWWLMGVKNPSTWGYYLGDLSNAYVSEAVKGGLVTLVGFVAILWQGFRRLGRARKAAASGGDHKLELLLWGFGASLFANSVAFIGIWYFDQSSLIWYALLAMICTITVTARVPVPVPERAAASGLRPETRGRGDSVLPGWNRSGGRDPTPHLYLTI